MFSVRGCEFAWQTSLVRKPGLLKTLLHDDGRAQARSAGLVTHGRMTNALADELRTMVGCLRLQKPRKLIAADMREPLLIFTDAALEGKLATAGMMMLDRSDGVTEMSGGVVKADTVKFISVKSEHLINGLELVPVYTALCQWSVRMLHRRVFVFIDNEAAWQVLMSHSCASMSMLAVLFPMV